MNEILGILLNIRDEANMGVMRFEQYGIESKDVLIKNLKDMRDELEQALAIAHTLTDEDVTGGQG